MKLLKKLALVAALSSIAGYASALTPIADSDLSKVSGQDGVSIAADLHINIGNFTYTDTDANGGSVAFNNIKINGTIGATLDIINSATFQGDAFGSVLGLTAPQAMGDATAAGAQGAAINAFYGGGDVVKIAIPKLAINSTNALNMSVDSIKMGGSAVSFGSMALNDVKLQGTTVYIWAH